jgi:hypothetical protein
MGCSERLYKRRYRTHGGRLMTIHWAFCEIAADAPVWDWLTGKTLEEVRAEAARRPWKLCRFCFPREQAPDRSGACEKDELPKTIEHEVG